MVKDGEIVYPGTEFTQNGELPPRKGMTFLKRLFLFFFFYSDDENGIQNLFCSKILVSFHLLINLPLFLF